MSHTRRDFLKAGLGASALLSFGPIAPRILVASHAGNRDTVLVVVQLSGGNDGLNTVVPYTDDAYARNRKTLRLPTGDLHKIDDHVAFHPRMEAFLRSAGKDGPNETVLESNGLFDIFVARYSPDGDLDFVTQIGGNGWDEYSRIAALPDDSAWVLGNFSNTAVFGQGEPNETTLTSRGDYAISIAKYE